MECDTELSALLQRFIHHPREINIERGKYREKCYNPRNYNIDNIEVVLLISDLYNSVQKPHVSQMNGAHSFFL